MPEGQPRSGLADLNERSREILRHIVDAYMESGEPVGSRTISRRLAMIAGASTRTANRVVRGAGCPDRTDDLPLTRRVLYQLS